MSGPALEAARARVRENAGRGQPAKEPAVTAGPAPVRALVILPAAGAPALGPNTRWFYLGQALKKAGVEVTIVGANQFHKFEGPVEPGETSVDGLTYYYLRVPPYRGRPMQVASQLVFGAQVLRRARRLAARHNPDVVVFSSPHPFGYWGARLAARAAKAAFVYEVRDLWPLVIQDLGGFSSHNPYIRTLKWIERHATRAADAVISVKEGDIDYLAREHGLSRDRFYWIPNGFLARDAEGGAAGRKPGGAAGRKPDDPVELVYAGSLTEYYDLSFFLEVARHLPSPRFRLKIIGSGPYLAKYREDCRRLGLTEVEFLGRLPRAEVMIHLASADFGVLPLKDTEANLYGISCNKLFEYMATGLPVLARYRSNFDPVARHACGENLHGLTPAEAAERVVALSDDAERSAACAENGRRAFARHHEFSALAPDVCAVFDQVLARRR